MRIISGRVLFSKDFESRKIFASSDKRQTVSGTAVALFSQSQRARVVRRLLVLYDWCCFLLYEMPLKKDCLE